MIQKNKLNELREMLSSVERTLFAARQVIAELSGEKTLMPADNFLRHQTANSGMEMTEEGRIIEGAFDGQGMVDTEGKTYPVPVNYASKSKIVVGDKMKLTITGDGKFLYKQIGPVERKNLVGTLVEEDGVYKVLAGGKSYSVLTASITFHKAKVGDEVSILLPEQGEAIWATFDAVIPNFAG